MKKFLMLAVAAACISAPAFAMDGDKMMQMSEAKMKMMDTNADGMVSKAEYDSMKDSMFMDMDTNKDGMISKDEMMSGDKMMHDKMMMKSDGMMKNDAMKKDSMMGK